MCYDTHMALLHSQSIQCPYCCQVIDIIIDSTITQQEYVEDCHVCCRPIILRIHADRDQNVSIDAYRENE